MGCANRANPELAYARGGACQFGARWGVWVSPWYGGTIPCEDKKLWPASYAVPGGGHSAAAFRRCLYLAYASGARVFTAQQTGPLFTYRDPARPEAGYALAAWGRELRGFAQYARSHRETVAPMTSLALLVDADNGWAPGNLWGNWAERQSVWGKLPADYGDAMLAGYLDALLPGYERTRDSWERKVIYPGYFAATPAGPFDIVTSDIPPERLSRYAAVALMGEVRMTRRLLGVLRAYVERGGTLLLNVDHMRDGEAFVQDRALLGATIGGTTFFVPWVGGQVTGRRIFVSSRIVRKLPLPGVDQPQFQEPWFCAQDVQPAGAAVAADDGEGHPVLLTHRFGRGQVYLSTPEYTMEGYNGRLKTLGFFRGLLHGMAGRSPVRVAAAGTALPAPDVSWVAARRGDVTLVCLANHGDTPTPVEVSWTGSRAAAALEVGTAVLDSRTDGPSARWLLTVPPQDIAIIGLRPFTDRSERACSAGVARSDRREGLAMTPIVR